MKKWNPWVRFIWDHWNLDMITWEQAAEETAIGYDTEIAEFKETRPMPQLKDYMTGLSGQWRHQTGQLEVA
ncbi:hypothetical protein SAMN05428985_11075 [Nocardioides sp. YR527]|uniref:hypothetical protein n=1 Tax=Nocardioides sp. YR527 TaxID=1881028 RepID=UPI000888D6F0|nr:hypothetical protein [Nocardioides sp. YR527]SDL15187.1 hypothetical protein SAMN05428985_11075 [Nocardioides sp. YR527]